MAGGVHRPPHEDLKQVETGMALSSPALEIQACLEVPPPDRRRLPYRWCGYAGQGGDMRLETFIKRSRFQAPVERLFAWHADPGALRALIPPGDPVTIRTRKGGLETGAVVVLSVGRGPFRIQWVAVHRDYILNRQFKDVQVKGPFARWEHTHLFEPDGPAASFLEDRVEYALPLGAAGRLAAGWLVRRKLEAMFAYRHAVTARAVETQP
jgi:ligand-binding SRPBCC domain-containing protein